jgi:hypothetical protein
MQALNEKGFAQAVESVLENVQSDKRGTNAMERSAELSETNCCLQMEHSRTRLILSASGHNYEVTGVWRSEKGFSPAFANGKPCKLRAAYRLSQLYNEIPH